MSGFRTIRTWASAGLGASAGPRSSAGLVRRLGLPCFTWAPWLALALAFVAGPATAQIGQGPLQTSEENPFYRLFYTPDAEVADVIGADAFRVESSASYSNIFEESSSSHHRQLFDMEQLTNAFTARYGISPSIEVGLRADLYTVWGGFMDEFISDFHQTFQFPNEGREKEPEGQYRFLLLSPGHGIALDVPRRTLQLEDLTAFAKWQWMGSSSEPFALSVKGVVREYTGPVGGPRTDVAASLLGRFSFGRSHVHASMGGTTLTPPEELAEAVPDAALFLSLGVERALTPGISAVAQFVGGSRYIEGFSGVNDLNSIPMTLALGFSGGTPGGWGWQVSFVEDLPPKSPSVDFTFDFELNRTFGGRAPEVAAESSPGR